MKTNVRIYSFKYTVFTIFYHSFKVSKGAKIRNRYNQVPTRLMFYERRLALCVFMKLCLVYVISR